MNYYNIFLASGVMVSNVRICSASGLAVVHIFFAEARGTAMPLSVLAVKTLESITILRAKKCVWGRCTTKN